MKKLEILQRKCTNCINSSENFLTVTGMISIKNLKFGWKLKNKCLPPELLKSTNTNHMGKTLNKNHNYPTQNKTTPNMPLVRSYLYGKSIFCAGIQCFNDLSAVLKDETNYKTYVSKCKHHVSGLNRTHNVTHLNIVHDQYKHVTKNDVSGINKNIPSGCV